MELSLHTLNPRKTKLRMRSAISKIAVARLKAKCAISSRTEHNSLNQLTKWLSAPVSLLVAPLAIRKADINDETIIALSPLGEFH
jgi:hypothetical protein